MSAHSTTSLIHKVFGPQRQVGALIDLGSFAHSTGHLEAGVAVQLELIDREQAQTEDRGLDVVPVVPADVVDEPVPHRESDSGDPHPTAAADDRAVDHGGRWGGCGRVGGADRGRLSVTDRSFRLA